MKRLRRVRHGVVLVTVMFLILVMGMLMRALIVGGPGLSRMANQTQDDLLCQRVAEIGATYAQAQLREKSDWKGDLNKMTVDMVDLKIVEDHGNVFGWSRAADGQASLFRIRFNFQDGPAGPDGLDDPTTSIDSIYVSLNNIANASDMVVPRADAGTYKVTNPTVGPTQAPRATAVVEIEGLAGTGVSAVTSPTSPLGNGHVARKVLRVVYAASVAASPVDASLSAGYGIDFETESDAVVSATAGSGDPRIRSKRQFTVKKPDGAIQNLQMTGKVSRDPMLGMTASVIGTVAQSDESIGDGKDFYSLKWSDVPVASADVNKAVQLQGGIYVLGLDGKLNYFDKSLTDYKALPVDGTGMRPGGVSLSADFREVRPAANLPVGGVNFDKTTFTMDVSKDVNINTSPGGVKDIVIAPLQGRRLHKADTTANYRLLSSDAQYSFGQVSIKNSTFSSKGNIAILLNLMGENASITSEGDAVLAAPSVSLKKDAMVNAQQRLSVYAQKDLVLSTFMSNPAIDLGMYGGSIPAFEGYGPLEMQGLAYSWKDAYIYSGTPGEKASTSPFGQVDLGKVSIKGAVIAYGADPVTGKPGSGGNGKIQLYAREASIEFDPTKLVADPGAATPGGPLKACKRLSYGFEEK
jgi:hypothetical protein